MSDTALPMTEASSRSPKVVPLPIWLDQLAALRLSSVQVEATFPRALRLDAPACAVLRGLLGERLRDLRCLTRAPTCGGCTEIAGCDYAAVFGAPPGQASDGTGSHPYWLQGISADREAPAGAKLRARLVVGASVASVLPYLDVALRDALARLGAGPILPRDARPRIEASRIGPLEFPAWTHGVRTWRIEARSPLILRGDTAACEQACPKVPSLALLGRAGVRRLDALLRASSTEGELPRVAFPDLRGVEVVEGELRPWTASRFSQRQGQRYPLSGLIGSLTVRGEGMSELGVLLQALAITSIGKATTMGFGALAVEPLG